MSKTKWAVGCFTAFLVVGTYLIAKFGVNPETILKIRLSEFQSEDQIAESVWTSIYGEIVASKTSKLLIGLDPASESQKKIAQSLIRVISQTPPTAGFPGNWALLTSPGDGRPTSPELFLNTPGKIIAPVSFLESVSFLQGSFAHHLIEEKVPDFMTILISTFPRSREEEATFPLPCSVATGDFNGTGEIGCAIFQTARPNYRKKTKPAPFVGILNQISSHDFLLLINSADKSRDSKEAPK